MSSGEERETAEMIEVAMSQDNEIQSIAFDEIMFGKRFVPGEFRVESGIDYKAKGSSFKKRAV